MKTKKIHSFRKTLFSQSWKIVLGLFVLVIAGELLFLSGSFNFKFSKPTAKTLVASKEQLQTLADQIVAKCASSSYHPTCYNESVPALMDNPGISMEQAFDVTRLIQTADSTFPYCHVLGHDLSAKEVDKNPDKWKDVVSRCPSGMCSNGCIHGGFQEKFRAETLTDPQITAIMPDLETICEKRADWNPTGLEQASCYHALGHMTMYMTNADIPKSIGLCQQISKKSDGRDYTQLCYDGVFMQIFQPLEPEDFALVKGKGPTKETDLAFCSKFDKAPKSSCMSESWPLFQSDIQSDPKNLVKFCSRFDEDQQGRCYEALIYVETAQFNFDPTKIEDYCGGLPADVQGSCFGNAASRFIETDYQNIDKSVHICSKAQLESAKSSCFSELLQYSTYNFHAGSPEFYELCNGLPSPWKQQCLTKS